MKKIRNIFLTVVGSVVAALVLYLLFLLFTDEVKFKKTISVVGHKFHLLNTSTDSIATDANQMIDKTTRVKERIDILKHGTQAQKDSLKNKAR